MDRFQRRPGSGRKKTRGEVRLGELQWRAPASRLDGDLKWRTVLAVVSLHELRFQTTPLFLNSMSLWSLLYLIGCLSVSSQEPGRDVDWRKKTWQWKKEETGWAPVTGPSLQVHTNCEAVTLWGKYSFRKLIEWNSNGFITLRNSLVSVGDRKGTCSVVWRRVERVIITRCRVQGGEEHSGMLWNIFKRNIFSSTWAELRGDGRDQVNQVCPLWWFYSRNSGFHRS